MPNNDNRRSTNSNRPSKRNPLNSQYSNLSDIASIGDIKKQDKAMKAYYKNLVNEQQKALSAMQNLNRKYNKELMKSRTSMNDEVERSFNKSQSRMTKSLDSMDKTMHKIFFTNRKKDIDGLSTHFTKFDKLFNSKIGKSISSAKDNVQEFVSGSNSLRTVASLSQDTADSWTDIRRSMQTKVRWNTTEWKKFSKQAQSIAKSLDYKISAPEVAGISNYLVNELGMDNIKDLKNYSKALAKNQLANGIDASSMKTLVELDKRYKANGKILEELGDQISALNKDGFHINSEDLTNTVSEMTPVITGKSKNKEQASRNIKEFTAVAAASASTYNEYLPEMLKTITEASVSDLGSMSADFGGAVDLFKIQKLMKQGKYQEASLKLIGGLRKANPDFLKTKGWTDEQITKVKDKGNISELTKNIEKARKSQSKSQGSMMESIHNLEMSVLDTLGNRWKSSNLNLALSDLTKKADMSTTEMLLAANLGVDFFGTLKGAGGKLFSKLFSKGTSDGIVKATTKSGLLKKVFSRGAVGGASTLGTSALSGASTAGAGSALAGGTSTAVAGSGAGAGALGLASKAAPWMSAALAFYDGVQGTSKAKQWKTSKASGFLGGALAGTGPGLSDEGSTGAKAWNVGKGALKGAGVGFLLGGPVGAAIGAGIGGVFSAIGGKKMAQFFDAFGKGAKRMWKGTLNLAGKAWNGIKNTAFEAYDKITDGATKILSDGFGGFTEKWGKGVGSIAEGFGKGGGSILHGFAEILHGTSSKFNIDENSVLMTKLDDIYQLLYNSGQFKPNSNIVENNKENAMKTLKGSTTKNVKKTGLLGQLGKLIGSFGKGADKLKSDGIAQVHKGEAILPAKLTESTESFIKAILPGARASYKRYGILPSITMAQAALESGWGKSAIGNNLFGIKAGSGWTGKKQYVWTTEVINGVSQKVKAWFRDYDSISDSILDHGKLLGTSGYYARVRSAKNYKDASYELGRSGYATAPNYGGTIRNLIESYGLNKYDKVGSYAVGNDRVQNDQLALIHKDEMIVPAKNNPLAYGKSYKLGNKMDSTNSEIISSSKANTAQVVDIIKWAVGRIESKLDGNEQSNNPTQQGPVFTF